MLIALFTILILISLVILAGVYLYNKRNKLYNTSNNARRKTDKNNEIHSDKNNDKNKNNNESNNNNDSEDKPVNNNNDKNNNDKNNNDRNNHYNNDDDENDYITGDSITNPMNENNDYINTQQQLLENKGRKADGQKNVPNECYLLNDLLKGEKPTYENADPNMTLYKGYEWQGRPIEKLSYCSTKCSSCDIINNQSQSGLWGTTLNEAEKTEVGSILPKFIYRRIDDDGKLIGERYT